MPTPLKMVEEEIDDLADSVEHLTAENAKLRTALIDCANDLEASVDAEYRGTLDYPSQRRKYDRDMEPVKRAREALGQVPTASR